MKNALLFMLVLCIAIINVALLGCSESRSQSAVVTKEGAIVATDGEIMSVAKLSVNEFQVRLWQCDAALVFDDEHCGNYGTQRLILQDVIDLRFPTTDFEITKIERVREKWGGGAPFTVYYISLKRKQ